MCNGGLLGSLGGCRRRHAHALADSPPDCRHRRFAATGLFSPRRRVKKYWTPQRVSSIFWSGLLGSLGGCRRRHARALADSPPDCRHRRFAATGLFSPRRRLKKYWTPKGCPVFFGAGDEARTRYLDLGKVALYQMSYARAWCLRPGSNWRHADFQSAALPTELPRHNGDQDGARTHDLQRDRLAF